MKAKVYISLKPGLLDAQGQTIKRALLSLGFTGVTDVRVGKYLELELSGGGAKTAKRDVERMCKQLLANPIVETYRIEIAQGSGFRARGNNGQPTAPNPQPRARAKQA